LDVKINGSHGAQQEISVSIKVSKEILPFPQGYPFKECDVKNDPIGHPESDKKIRLPVLSEIRLHPKTSDSATLVSTKAVICAVVASKCFRQVALHCQIIQSLLNDPFFLLTTSQRVDALSNLRNLARA